jgi:hypothetical protein
MTKCDDVRSPQRDTEQLLILRFTLHNNTANAKIITILIYFVSKFINLFSHCEAKFLL